MFTLSNIYNIYSLPKIELGLFCCLYLLRIELGLVCCNSRVIGVLKIIGSFECLHDFVEYIEKN